MAIQDTLRFGVNIPAFYVGRRASIDDNGSEPIAIGVAVSSRDTVELRLQAVSISIKHCAR